MYPRPKDVKYIDDYKLLVTFDNMERRIFDAKDLLDDKWFASLRNKGLFKNARVMHKTLEWPNGTDICPDDLYGLSKPFNDLNCKD